MGKGFEVEVAHLDKIKDDVKNKPYLSMTSKQQERFQTARYPRMSYTAIAFKRKMSGLSKEDDTMESYAWRDIRSNIKEPGVN